MTPKSFSPELIDVIAARFKALSEPARLQILNRLRNGPMTVTDLVVATGLGQANVSKHLQFLYTVGFVGRRKDGLFTYYSLADKDVFKLCDIMCDRVATEVADRRKALAR